MLRNIDRSNMPLSSTISSVSTLEAIFNNNSNLLAEITLFSSTEIFLNDDHEINDDKELFKSHSSLMQFFFLKPRRNNTLAHGNKSFALTDIGKELEKEK
jgi:hypothetical protein